MGRLERLKTELVELLRQQGATTLEYESREVEHAFALLVLGSLVGLPHPPTSIVLRVGPLMLREIAVMYERAERSDDFFGEIVAQMGPP